MGEIVDNLVKILCKLWKKLEILGRVGANLVKLHKFWENFE